MSNVVYEHYDNICKFVETIKARPYNGVSGLGTESKTSAINWAGMALDKSYEAVLTGLPDKKTVLEKAVCDFSELMTTTGRTTRNYYYGYAPNVGRALQGLPKSMKQRVKAPKQAKTIHIIYNSAMNCGTDAKTIEQASIATLNLIYSLESAGIRCKLTILSFFAERGNDVAICGINLKDYADSFDFLKLSFPLTQVAFFRRLGFRWIEGVKGLKESWYAYGRTIEGEKEGEKIIKSLVSSNSSFLYLNVERWKKMKFNVQDMVNEVKKNK